MLLTAKLYLMVDWFRKYPCSLLMKIYKISLHSENQLLIDVIYILFCIFKANVAISANKTVVWLILQNSVFVNNLVWMKPYI